jgi:UDP-glucose 4-epimerase
MVAFTLAQQGHSVVVYDNLCHSTRALLPSGVEFVQGELADRSSLEKLLSSGFDGVMHFAALIEAGESITVPPPSRSSKPCSQPGSENSSFLQLLPSMANRT